MKVLLYAVFKERGVDSPSAGDRITKDERIANASRNEPSKLNSAAQKILRLFRLDFVARSLMVARPLRFLAPRET
jgi:hypothetical protein